MCWTRSAMTITAIVTAIVVYFGAYGCAEAGIAAGAGTGVLLAARAPAQDFEQIYYLGVLDYSQQLPMTVYRVTVRGQSSAFSNIRFASGWLQAEFVDVLGTDVNEAHNKEPELLNGSDRRLVLLGPEGFRTAPTNYRLVITMGSKPSAIFEAATCAQVLQHEMKEHP
jgi:hypothetical protein